MEGEGWRHHSTTPPPFAESRHRRSLFIVIMSEPDFRRRVETEVRWEVVKGGVGEVRREDVPPDIKDRKRVDGGRD